MASARKIGLKAARLEGAPGGEGEVLGRVGGVVLRTFAAGDLGGVEGLHGRCFGDWAAPGVSFAEHWNWRYRDNPDGKRVALAVDEGGRVLAQYAGSGGRWDLGGERVQGSQSTDSMLDPGKRVGLKRVGLFVELGRRYAERFGGRGPGLDQVQWGVPIRPALRMGRRFLGYRLLRPLVLLVREVEGVRPFGAGGVEVREVQSAPEELDGLAERWGREGCWSGVRDRMRVEWRFFGLRSMGYRVAVVRGARGVIGYGAVRVGEVGGVRGLVLVDWMTGRDEVGARSALLAWARECARGVGEEFVLTTAPEWAPEWMELQRQGMRARGTDLNWVVRSYSRAIDVDEVRRRAWMTLGDTDLC